MESKDPSDSCVACGMHAFHSRCPPSWLWRLGSTAALKALPSRERQNPSRVLIHDLTSGDDVGPIELTDPLAADGRFGFAYRLDASLVATGDTPPVGGLNATPRIRPGLPGKGPLMAQPFDYDRGILLIDLGSHTARIVPAGKTN